MCSNSCSIPGMVPADDRNLPHAIYLVLDFDSVLV